MTEKREYPPAVLVHSEPCPDAATLRGHGVTLTPMITPAIARAYPNGRMHNCYHFTLQGRGVVESDQSGVPIAKIADQLGHTDPAITACLPGPRPHGRQGCGGGVPLTPERQSR